MPNKRFCVVVADCHALSREALSALLMRALPDALVMELSVGMCLKLEPGFSNIMLFSLRPPYLKALERMGTVRDMYPELPILVLSDAVDSRIEQMVRARGAKGLFHAEQNVEALLAMINHLQDGNSGFPTERRSIAREDFRFTRRQAEVLDLLCKGKSNKEIGLDLNMSEFTVRSHVSAIFTILGTRNRTEAVLAGRSWVQSPPEQDNF